MRSTRILAFLNAVILQLAVCNLLVSQSAEFDNTGVFRITNNNGFVRVGPANGSFSHFYTSMPGFFFSKKVTFADGIDTYNDANLVINTPTGWVSLGPINTNYSHFNTNMPGFYFYKNTTFKEGISADDGNLRVNTDDGWVSLGPKNNSFSHFETDRPGFYFSRSITIGGDSEIGTYQNRSLKLLTNDEDRLIINGDSGHVGIGLDPSGSTSLLTVNGSIEAEEITVKVNPGQGPDYVFEKGYELKSIEEVMKFIEENGHLPEVPSAQDMEENGIGLAEMNLVLLKKIEELTLLLAEQNERIDLLEKRGSDL